MAKTVVRQSRTTAQHGTPVIRQKPSDDRFEPRADVYSANGCRVAENGCFEPFATDAALRILAIRAEPGLSLRQQSLLIQNLKAAIQACETRSIDSHDSFQAMAPIGPSALALDNFLELRMRNPLFLRSGAKHNNLPRQ